MTADAAPARPSPRFAGDVAIVTGGGRGLGKVFAHALADAGCRVVVGDVDEAGAAAVASAIVAAGGDAVAVACDVADAAQVHAMVDLALARYGTVDILVNNAALFAELPLEPLEDVSVETWDRVMAVNLRGPFLCAQAVAPIMKAHRHGRIVNISSGSIHKGNPLRIHYVSAKSGLLGLTRSLARALGEWGVAVNALLPGATASETALAAYPVGHFESRLEGRALRRVEVPDDLVGPLLFLCSRHDSGFITGQSLIVDGGNHML